MLFDEQAVVRRDDCLRLEEDWIRHGGKWEENEERGIRERAELIREEIREGRAEEIETTRRGETRHLTEREREIKRERESTRSTALREDSHEGAPGDLTLI